MSVNIDDKITFDVMAPIPSENAEKGVRWIRLGTAWGKLGRRGYQVSLQLDSLPTARDWDGRLLLFDSGRPAATTPPPPVGRGSLPDEDIPF